MAILRELYNFLWAPIETKEDLLVYIFENMAEGLYASCAEVLSMCQTFKDDLAAVLDPESGFAPRMRELCEQQWVLQVLEGPTTV